MSTTSRQLSLILLPQQFSIVRLDSQAPLPDWAACGSFFSINRTDDELSVVTESSNVPVGLTCQSGWRLLKVQGPFLLSEVGVLAALASTIAEAGVSLFAISTYDTDYLLVSSTQLEKAALALGRAGHKLLQREQAL
jgi:hypothetical protein